MKSVKECAEHNMRIYDSFPRVIRDVLKEHPVDHRDLHRELHYHSPEAVSEFLWMYIAKIKG